MLKTITVTTRQRNQFLNITREVEAAVRASAIEQGIATVFVPHTTAAVTINENADPDVVRDILYKLEDAFPQRDNYQHSEGNSDAHLKSSIIGASIQVIVSEGKLLLGTWQGIFFCEFDGPRSRQVHIQVN